MWMTFQMFRFVGPPFISYSVTKVYQGLILVIYPPIFCPYSIAFIMTFVHNWKWKVYISWQALSTPIWKCFARKMFEILDDSSGCRKLGPSKASQTKEVRSSTKLLSCHTLFTPAHTYNVLHFQYNTFFIIITEILILILSIFIALHHSAQTNENRPQN